MDLETVFSFSSAVVLPGWLVLALAPGWRFGREVLAPVILPAVVAVVYLLLIVTGPPGAEGGGFDSLAGVRVLFTSDQALLAGWVHYLVFDLLIGAWEVRDARENEIHHGLVLPCLFFTLMLGPIGWLSYMVVRTVVTRRLGVGRLGE